MDAMPAVADRFFAAIEAGDIDGVRAVYAPDARVWTNVAGADQDLAANLATLGWLCRHTASRRYDVTRREAIEGGFLQQHILHLELDDGTRFAMPACLVVTLRDGRIARIEEYLDGAAVGDLRKALNVA